MSVSDRPYRDAGRRLYAAVLSYRMGKRSIDDTLRKDVPENIDPSWDELAESLDRGMAEAAYAMLFPPQPRK